MPESDVLVSRPQRWDVPFGAHMDDDEVARLMAMEPFRSMDESAFPTRLSLRGILRNDTRIVDAQNGDLIVREGDYGSSAFLILEGHVRVALQALSPDILGRQRPERHGWRRAIAQLLRSPQRTEVRKQPGGGKAFQNSDTGLRSDADDTHVFLQDVPRVLDQTHTARLGPGEIFGELAAIARTPRTATVFAEGDAQLLEIRWQGLRDLMGRTPALRQQIERLYRENSLRVHLRETPFLNALPAAAIDRVAEATLFESYGNFDWNAEFPSFGRRDPLEQLAQEPLIAEEGQVADSLLLIRSGFARLSHRYGNGHRTVAYLGKGQVFAWAELLETFRNGHETPLACSLRAVGYVDVLRIPGPVVCDAIFANLPDQFFSEHTIDREPKTARSETHAATDNTPSVDARMLDFLVDHRLINGTQTMLIDLDRCTRCDDCVRACAATHDNNPRFIRHGPKYDHWMVANACMHCVDPVCMIGCPTGAIARDSATGVVRINDRTCIGCATCANSCPYDAIRMVEIRDASGAFFIDQQSQLPVVKATKCDLCVDGIGGPACQNACPHDALVRIDMSDLPALASWLGR